VGGGDEEDEDEIDCSPVPFEGVLDRGVIMIDLVSLDSRETSRQFREALKAIEYDDVPKGARVLTGPYWGSGECKIRTTTQRGFYSEASVREYYERANTVYRVSVDVALGYWKVWLGDKQ
jgi:hypothetical protein